MARHRALRGFAALLLQVVFMLGLVGDAFGAHHCPHHDRLPSGMEEEARPRAGAVPAAHAADAHDPAAGYAAHAGQAAHAGHTGHVGHTAHPGHAAHGGDAALAHGDAAPGDAHSRHGPCTCLGSCSGAQSAVLRAADAAPALRLSAVDAPLERAATPLLPERVPYLLPFANAPPLFG